MNKKTYIKPDVTLHVIEGATNILTSSVIQQAQEDDYNNLLFEEEPSTIWAD